jgi:SH3 domain protein
MKQRIAELETEVSRLDDTNSKLQDRSQRDWFLTGAGVLGGGIFLGLVLPMLRRKKQSGFDLR